MIWNDIKEIKQQLAALSDRMRGTEVNISDIHYKIFDQSDDKLDKESVQKLIEKLEDHQKNFDKLGTMINELKGCVSLARSAVAERKQKDYVV